MLKYSEKRDDAAELSYLKQLLKHSAAVIQQRSSDFIKDYVCESLKILS